MRQTLPLCENALHRSMQAAHGQRDENAESHITHQAFATMEPRSDGTPKCDRLNEQKQRPPRPHVLRQQHVVEAFRLRVAPAKFIHNGKAALRVPLFQNNTVCRAQRSAVGDTIVFPADAQQLVVVQHEHTLAVEHRTQILSILFFALQDYARASEHLQTPASALRLRAQLRVCKARVSILPPLQAPRHLARRTTQPAADAHSALHAPARHATARVKLRAAQSLGSHALYRRFFFFRPVRIARARSSSSRAVVYL